MNVIDRALIRQMQNRSALLDLFSNVHMLGVCLVSLYAELTALNMSISSRCANSSVWGGPAMIWRGALYLEYSKW